MGLVRSLLALHCLAAPALAQDFSASSEAQPWNLYAEVPARFEAQVVDALCAITGECAQNCGGGLRQMALLRSADGVMVLALKNNEAAFSGAALDLAPYCGQTVEVDGLMLEDPDLGAHNLYMVQRIRTAGGEWAGANRFTSEWALRNPDAGGNDPWFRRDPRVKAEIARDGYFGLGPDVDAAYIDANK